MKFWRYWSRCGEKPLSERRKAVSFGKVKIDAADKYFSLYIRNRAKWNCERCGKHYEPPTSALHCSHFIGRGKENTRFDLDNASAHCYGCHQYLTSHPAEHVAWKIEQVGERAVNILMLKSNMYCKKDRESEKIYWRAKLKEDYGV